MSSRLVQGFGLFLMIQLGSFVAAGDAPDSEVNNVTGQIESVDAELSGQDYNLRHTVDPGQGAPGATALLTTSPANDRRPRMAITPDGAAWVVWWREASVDAVLARGRDVAGAWEAERLVSAPGESSRNPEIVLFGGETWVAYEFTTTGGTGIGAVAIDDSPDPFGRTVLATSEFSGAVDVQIFSASGHLWVSWVQDATSVGWSTFDPLSRTWTLAQYESYGAPDGVPGARNRIRAEVLGP
jgi:hypothetical protein